MRPGIWTTGTSEKGVYQTVHLYHERDINKAGRWEKTTGREKAFSRHNVCACGKGGGCHTWVAPERPGNPMGREGTMDVRGRERPDMPAGVVVVGVDSWRDTVGSENPELA